MIGGDLPLVLQQETFEAIDVDVLKVGIPVFFSVGNVPSTNSKPRHANRKKKDTGRYGFRLEVNEPRCREYCAVQHGNLKATHR